MVTAVEKKKKEALNTIKTNEKKWGKTLMNAGWTAFPSIILEKQHALGLDALDVNIILYLSTYWWESENLPHPSKKTIAEAIGVDPRTVQRRIAGLEKGGFLRREYRSDKEKGNKSNKYDFEGLIKESEPFAQEKINAVQERQRSEAARKKRIRPATKSTEGGKGK